MDAFVGEIRVFPYTFEPYGWFWCEGQTVNLQMYAALFSLIGTVYGGDGRTNFKLPDLRGLSAVAATQSNGTPPARTPYQIGQTFGSTDVVAPLVAHAHQVKSGYLAGASRQPQATTTSYLFGSQGNYDFAPPGTTAQVAMAAQSLGIAPAGSGAAMPHNNIQPYLTLHFAINWNGEYPIYD